MRILLSSIDALTNDIFSSRLKLSTMVGNAIPDLAYARATHDNWHTHSTARAGAPVCLCVDWNYHLYGGRVGATVLFTGLTPGLRRFLKKPFRHEKACAVHPNRLNQENKP
jgi:hypothetical protein